MTRVTGACAGFFLTMLVFIQCKKEYSYEGGVAVFTILNTSGQCAATVTGNYRTGMVLDQSNTVQLQIDVTTPGKFSLQTNSAGGMHFSTSGSLTDTGIQTLSLSGSGTAAKAGDYSFTPETTPACDFTVSVTDKPVTIADYTLSGAPNACQDPQVSGQYVTGKALSSSDFVSLNVNVDAIGDYSIHTDTLIGIYFSASGTFTKTGPQIINLTGSGIPNDNRHVVFTPKGTNGSGCTFDLTVQKPGSPATYVIVSGQNLCVGTVAGAYAAGTPLDAANTYTLQVYVAETGDFTISTPTVNGVYFYYSGTFTAKDNQNVTLQGYGTPTAIGDFVLSPQIIGPAPLGGVECDFTLSVK